MPIYRDQSVLSEIHGEDLIPLKTREYFRRHVENRFHEMILEAFIEQAESEGLTQTELAARIDQGTDQISQWLHTASNYTVDTIADLLLAMKVRLDDPTYTSFATWEKRLTPEEE